MFMVLPRKSCLPKGIVLWKLYISF